MATFPREMEKEERDLHLTDDEKVYGMLEGDERLNTIGQGKKWSKTQELDEMRAENFDKAQQMNESHVDMNGLLDDKEIYMKEKRTHFM